MSQTRERRIAFFEQFQDNWDTNPSFRATWSFVAAGLALVLMIVCLVTALSASGSILHAIGGNATATTKPDTGQRADVGAATYTITPPTPAAAAVSEPGPVTVPNSGSPPPSPTVSPTPPGTPAGTPPAGSSTTMTTTPDPNQTQTPGVNPTPTTTSQYQLPTQAPIPWLPGQQATIFFYSDQSQANKQISFTLNFGNGCNYGPDNSILKPDGSSAMRFTVPNCVKGQGLDVIGTFNIQGQPALQYHFVASDK